MKSPEELHQSVLQEVRQDSGNVQYRVSYDRGATWESWYTVAAEAETVGPDVVLLDDGRPFVSWRKSDGTWLQYVCTAVDGSGSWGSV